MSLKEAHSWSHWFNGLKFCSRGHILQTCECRRRRMSLRAASTQVRCVVLRYMSLQTVFRSKKEKLGCLIGTGRHIAMQCAFLSQSAILECFGWFADVQFCDPHMLKKKGSSKWALLKHVTRTNSIGTCSFDFYILPFWNFRHRLVRLYW